MSDITAKASPNYTDEMLDTMREEYVVEPTRETVESLAIPVSYTHLTLPTILRV